MRCRMGRGAGDGNLCLWRKVFAALEREPTSASDRSLVLPRVWMWFASGSCTTQKTAMEPIAVFCGAGDGNRTRGNQLGKLAPYH